MFILYSTLGCHLCDQAEQLITPLMAYFQLSSQRLDISAPDHKLSDQSAEQLIARFGEQIPVLGVTFSQLTLAWPFDQAAVLQFIQALMLEAERAEQQGDA